MPSVGNDGGVVQEARKQMLGPDGLSAMSHGHSRRARRLLGSYSIILIANLPAGSPADSFACCLW